MSKYCDLVTTGVENPENTCIFYCKILSMNHFMHFKCESKTIVSSSFFFFIKFKNKRMHEHRYQIKRSLLKIQCTHIFGFKL